MPFPPSLREVSPALRRRRTGAWEWMQEVSISEQDWAALQDVWPAAYHHREPASAVNQIPHMLRSPWPEVGDRELLQFALYLAGAYAGGPWDLALCAAPEGASHSDPMRRGLRTMCAMTTEEREAAVALFRLVAYD